MSRKNIFEKLESNYNLYEEINVIESLIRDEQLINLPLKYGATFVTVEEYIDEYCIRKWKQRNLCTSCDEIRKKIEINNIISYKEINSTDLFTYLEYVINLIYLIFAEKKKVVDNSLNIEQVFIVFENVINLLNKFNHEVKYIKEEEKALVIEKNAAATAVAEIVNEQTALKVIEYNHYFLKGDINQKSVILSALANEFDPKRDKLKANGYSNVESDGGFLLNNLNIRHNNTDVKSKDFNQYTKDMDNDTLELWYDKTYNVMLLAILCDDYISLHSEIDELKENYKKD